MASGNGNVATTYDGTGVSSLKVTDKVMNLSPSAFNANDTGTLTTQNAAVTAPEIPKRFPISAYIWTTLRFIIRAILPWR